MAAISSGHVGSALLADESEVMPTSLRILSSSQGRWRKAIDPVVAARPCPLSPATPLTLPPANLILETRTWPPCLAKFLSLGHPLDILFKWHCPFTSLSVLLGLVITFSQWLSPSDMLRNFAHLFSVWWPRDDVSFIRTGSCLFSLLLYPWSLEQRLAHK